jgi:valyl-tRNA synthetase
VFRSCYIFSSRYIFASGPYWFSSKELAIKSLNGVEKEKKLYAKKWYKKELVVTSQDFIKFWGKFFAFVLLEMFGNSQGFKNFFSLFESFIRKIF